MLAVVKKPCDPFNVSKPDLRRHIDLHLGTARRELERKKDWKRGLGEESMRDDRNLEGVMIKMSAWV